jgi:mRNA-degrading endonuclease RelE of RelBE toxin-antitoxin system
MKVTIKTSFERDIKKYRDEKLKQHIFDLISKLKDEPNLYALPYLKKLKGYKYSYKIAFQKYRICMNIIDNEICIVRFLNRDENTYKKFP